MTTKFNMVSWTGPWNRKKQTMSWENWRNLKKICNLVNGIAPILSFDECTVVIQAVNIKGNWVKGM